MHYQAIFNERGAATLQTSLKVSSGANGFKVMDPFPNYPEENVVKGENVPNFKINTSKGAPSNAFQILQDL